MECLQKVAAIRVARVAMVAVCWLATGCSKDTPTTRDGTQSGAGATALPVGGTSGSAGSAVIAAGSSAAGTTALGGAGSGTAGTAVPGGSGGAGGMGGAVMPAGSGAAGTPMMGNTEPPPPPGDWGTADPSMKGSFATVVENNVGPDMAFTMFRPMTLTKKHPLITWGNGTGTTPNVYSFLLTHLASHGFVIIASNSMNVAMGTPPPMLQGVTWVGEQNADPMSPLYQHIDMDHVGATGHSQGAFATSSAAADPAVTVWAPIEGARAVRGQHGPGLLICGTMDTTVPCSGAMSAFTSATVPVMYAELKAASHTNWFGGFGTVHPIVVIVTAWMRVHLMGDSALKPMFYGASCKYCSDDAWVIQQKMLD
jgi:hypothetical protein